MPQSVQKRKVRKEALYTEQRNVGTHEQINGHVSSCVKLICMSSGKNYFPCYQWPTINRAESTKTRKGWEVEEHGVWPRHNCPVKHRFSAFQDLLHPLT